MAFERYYLNVYNPVLDPPRLPAAEPLSNYHVGHVVDIMSDVSEGPRIDKCFLANEQKS